MKHQSASLGLVTALDITDAYGLPGRTGSRLQDHDDRLRYRTVDERHELPAEAVVAREPVGHDQDPEVPKPAYLIPEELLARYVELAAAHTAPQQRTRLADNLDVRYLHERRGHKQAGALPCKLHPSSILIRAHSVLLLESATGHAWGGLEAPYLVRRAAGLETGSTGTVRLCTPAANAHEYSGRSTSPKTRCHRPTARSPTPFPGDWRRTRGERDDEGEFPRSTFRHLNMLRRSMGT